MRLRSGREFNEVNDQDNVVQDAAVPGGVLVQRGASGAKCWKRGGWQRQPETKRLGRRVRLNKYKD